MASNRILYVCQEVAPYVPDTEGALLCRKLSQAMQERGNEIRTFMPDTAASTNGAINCMR